MRHQRFDSSSLAEARQRLAERMRELRTAAHMPQGAAAARAGIDRTTWNRIELAKMADIRLETLLRIEYALGVDTLEALFGETTGDLFRSQAPDIDDAERRSAV
jgi:transcriptional regulator with XRE-family HTH domain